MNGVKKNRSTTKSQTMPLLVSFLAVVTLASCAPPASGSPASGSLASGSPASVEGSPSAPLTRLPDDPEVEPVHTDIAPPPDRTVETMVLKEPPTDPKERAAILAQYAKLDPKKVVPKNLLEKAILTFDTNSTSFSNKNYLGVVDFSKRSNKARWFIIELKTGSVWSIHVAHGTGSDKDGDGYAESFSNVDGSNASSIGVYRTAEQYESSKFGKALRVDGLSKTNSNVRSRAIVIHPAWYVWEADVIEGRTWGCLGVSSSLSSELIDKIKNGSMILADLSGQK